MTVIQKTIQLTIAGLEEITLAFGPHPSGILSVYMPVDVPTAELFVTHQVFPTPDKPGAPIVELLKIKPVKLLEKPAEFKLIHKVEQTEEIINVIVQTLVLAPEKKVPLTK